MHHWCRRHDRGRRQDRKMKGLKLNDAKYF